MHFSHIMSCGVGGPEMRVARFCSDSRRRIRSTFKDSYMGIKLLYIVSMVS